MPLTATIAPVAQRRAPAATRVAACQLPRRQQPQRAARTPGRRWAGRGSAGRPVVVLGPAGARTLEARHRRQRPVVGDAAHDREPRPAVRAVDERVAVAAVGGVEELGAGSRRRWRCRPRPARRGSPPCGLARIAKPRAPDGATPRATALDRRQRRRLRRAAAQEALDGVDVALDLEQDAALVVEARTRRARARSASR